MFLKADCHSFLRGMFLVNGGRLPYYVPRVMDNGLGHELHLIAPVRAAPQRVGNKEKSSISCAPRYNCAEFRCFLLLHFFMEVTGDGCSTVNHGKKLNNIQDVPWTHRELKHILGYYSFRQLLCGIPASIVRTHGGIKCGTVWIKKNT